MVESGVSQKIHGDAKSKNSQPILSLVWIFDWGTEIAKLVLVSGWLIV